MSKLLQFILLVVAMNLSSEYEIILEKISPLDPPNIIKFDTFRVKKFNRSIYVLDGNFKVEEDLDDTISLKFAAHNFQGRTYRQVLIKEYNNFCKTIYDVSFEKHYNGARPFTNFPEFNTCPFPAGKYFFKDYLVQENGILPPYVPGSPNWKLDIRFYRGNDLLGGYDVFATLNRE